MNLSQSKIKVLIVDDHLIVRQGLRTFLELHEDVVVIGEAEDGLVAVEMVRQLNPDVVLMDLVMRRLDGIAAIRQIKSLAPDIAVIALTSFTEDDKVFPAIQAGASGYLLKDVTPEELIEAIRAAHRGEARLHPDITRKLMERVVPPPSHASQDRSEYLTVRELQVVRLVSKGFSNHEIAKELVISAKTVKTHVSNILSKLHLEDRTQLAIYALKHAMYNDET